MAGDKNKLERSQTDASLRTEREKADRALADTQAVAEKDADDVVQRAREIADAVLSEARDKADVKLSKSDPALHAQEAIEEERVLEDEALEGERDSADAALQRERDLNSRALAKLLPLEREKTDTYLLTERTRSDGDVSNRDDFLAIVSHDLRNLLGGIVLSAALLTQRAATQPDAQLTLKETERIKRYSARMNRLIGDLVDIASIDAGKLAVLAVPSDLTALVAEAIESFQVPAAEQGITLESNAQGPMMAMFDHDRMLQVLANLISNAFKFTPKGGKVSFRIGPAGNQLRVSVEDTGSGVPETMLESIFERFWQVGKNDRRGVGLGLYISRCIVQAHGGKIWAESVVDNGTTLIFTLPLPA